MEVDVVAGFTTLMDIQMKLIYSCIGLAAVCTVLIVLCIINASAIKKLKKNYQSFMQEDTNDGVTIEQLLNTYVAETRAVASQQQSIDKRTSSLENQIPSCFQKIGVVRYNPFEDTGGDLSYAIAILNEENTGVILNGIYNRTGSYTYAKEIENGVCHNHKLSGEELDAMRQAMENKPVRRFS